MSKSGDNFVIKDVLGDGSCFYRALYASAQHADVVPQLVSILAGRDRKKHVSENKFVQLLRRYLSKRVQNEDDAGIVKDVFEYLHTIDSSNYSEVLQAFPSWFRAQFKKKPKDLVAFREQFAQGILETHHWVSEIEIRIIHAILASSPLRLEVLNTKPKGKRTWKRGTLYVLNRNEAHYLAILPMATSKSTSASPPASSSKSASAITISHNKVQKTIKKARKSCAEGSLLNPATKRCVKATSCKGYELQAEIFKRLLGIPIDV